MSHSIHYTLFQSHIVSSQLTALVITYKLNHEKILNKRKIHKNIKDQPKHKLAKLRKIWKTKKLNLILNQQSSVETARMYTDITVHNGRQYSTEHCNGFVCIASMIYLPSTERQRQHLWYEVFH